MKIHCSDKVYIRFGEVSGEGYLWFCSMLLWPLCQTDCQK